MIQLDQVWPWICRGLATAGFIDLIVTSGLDTANLGVCVLLMGLFFGPEVIKRQRLINLSDPDGEDSDSSPDTSSRSSSRQEQ